MTSAKSQALSCWRQRTDCIAAVSAVWAAGYAGAHQFWADSLPPRNPVRPIWAARSSEQAAASSHGPPKETKPGGFNG